jgi:hypothetical protein
LHLLQVQTKHRPPHNGKLPSLYITLTLSIERIHSQPQRTPKNCPNSWAIRQSVPFPFQYPSNILRFQKSESNTTTPKAGSFDEQNYFEWKKGEESVVLDRYFMGRSNERSPNTAKSVVIMENSSSFLNLSPTRIDNSPDRYSSKVYSSEPSHC